MQLTNSCPPLCGLLSLCSQWRKSGYRLTALLAFRLWFWLGLISGCSYTSADMHCSKKKKTGAKGDLLNGEPGYGGRKVGQRPGVVHCEQPDRKQTLSGRVGWHWVWGWAWPLYQATALSCRPQTATALITQPPGTGRIGWGSGWYRSASQMTA